MKEGASEGIMDGASEGIKDGASDGSREGASEGIMEGASDGSNDGASDGRNDGVSDGVREGASDRDGEEEAIVPIAVYVALRNEMGGTVTGTMVGKSDLMGDIVGKTISAPP